jgi:hypothetical protein
VISRPAAPGRLGSELALGDPMGVGRPGCQLSWPLKRLFQLVLERLSDDGAIWIFSLTRDGTFRLPSLEPISRLCVTPHYEWVDVPESEARNISIKSLCFSGGVNLGSPRSDLSCRP